MKKTLILPDTLQECHAMIISMARQIEQLQRRSFSSLKDRAIKYDGPSLFDDIDKEAEVAKSMALKKAQEEVDKSAVARRKATNAKIPSKRPEKYNTYGLPEKKRVETPEGIDLENYDVIGTDTSRVLHIEQMKMWVEVIERPVLRLKADKNSPNPQICQSPTPKSIIGGGHVAADMLATIIVNKYNHHLPEYRQVKMFAEQGLKLPTSTVNDWIHAVANALYPLYEYQREAVLSGGYVQIDEVPWKIADRKGQSCRNGYAWQFRDVSPNSHGTYFFYHKGSRAGEIPRTQLRDYKGVIQTDGYKVYDYFENVPGITNLACMAHVRRKFVDAQKSNPLAGEAVNYIATLYSLEENLSASGATPEEIRQERQRLAVPILDGIESWMKVALTTSTPQDPLAKAIKYALTLWPRIKQYTEDGNYLIDSNPVERGQRPSVLGRKNYLFSQTDRGAEDNAIFYTFIVSCENLGINPHHWLEHTLNHIYPDIEEVELQALLPYNYKADKQ